MPSPNLLFSTLKSYSKSNSQSSSSSSSAAATQAINVNFKLSPDGQSIAIVPMPTPTIPDLSYDIQVTYISFFESLTSFTDSAYNYTAKLIKSEQLITVHVHFSNHGEVQIHSDELTDIEKEFFKQTAIHACKPIIDQIKAFQQSRIQQLSTTISEVLNSDSVSFKKIIPKMLELAQELESIGGSKNFRKKILSRLDELQWAEVDAFLPSIHAPLFPNVTSSVSVTTEKPVGLESDIVLKG